MNYKNVLIGKSSKSAGEIFERMIERSCEIYEEKGTAVIEKTPEPMRVLKRLGNGRFEACFAKAAQPDFKGVLHSGRTVMFEAKHTDDNRIMQSRVTEVQTERLLRYEKMNALCFVLVSVQFSRFYAIPINVWCNMKELYNHKYMNLAELKEFEVKRIGALIDFLGTERKNDKQGDIKRQTLS